MGHDRSANLQEIRDFRQATMSSFSALREDPADLLLNVEAGSPRSVASSARSVRNRTAEIVRIEVTVLVDTGDGPSDGTIHRVGVPA